MKCNKCGKEQSDKAVVCPYCGFRFIKEITKEAPLERSTLIEFPSSSNKSQRNNPTSVTSANSDWRAELSAKVRQVKERRNMQEARGRLQAELEAAAQRYQQANQSSLASTALVSSLPPINNATSNLDLESDRPSNPVIEAALKRAQRASEIAVKTQIPTMGNASIGQKIGTLPNTQTLPQTQTVAKSTNALTEVMPNQVASVNNVSTKLVDSDNEAEDEQDILSKITNVSNLSNLDNPSSLTSKFDKIERDTLSIPSSPRIISTLPKTLSTSTVGATAVAMAPLVIDEEEIVESHLLTQYVPSTEYIPSTEYVPVTEEINLPENEKNFPLEQLEQLEQPEALKQLVENEEQKEQKTTVRVIKESEAGPNYLDELIAVCEQNRSLSSDAANASQRLIAATIDLIIIATASSIFWGSSYTLGINLTDERILTILGATSIFVGLIYLTMMVFVSARTFGMMFVGTRVINSNTKESPSILQAFLRAVGYFLSVGFLGLGFAWMFLDHERRTLHDVVSGTFVVRDY
jgi:uncharacterized RDD family membrane protein YckC